jgi:hypothetical protein
MGGTINLTDPPAASGDEPGHTIALYTDCGLTWDPTLSGAGFTGEYINTGLFKPNTSVFYFTDHTGRAGGIIDLVESCTSTAHALNFVDYYKADAKY